MWESHKIWPSKIPCKCDSTQSCSNSGFCWPKKESDGTTQGDHTESTNHKRSLPTIKFPLSVSGLRAQSRDWRGLLRLNRLTRPFSFSLSPAPVSVAEPQLLVMGRRKELLPVPHNTKRWRRDTHHNQAYQTRREPHIHKSVCDEVPAKAIESLMKVHLECHNTSPSMSPHIVHNLLGQETFFSDVPAGHKTRLRLHWANKFNHKRL